MPLRNIFKRPAVPEIVEPKGADRDYFEDATVSAAKLVEDGPVEYPLSEINDSGVFLPPTPIDKPSGFWSSRSNSSRSTISDSEHFVISRESFDSYRRSFDISARSPIPSASPEYETFGRLSLESQVSFGQLRFRQDRSIEWPRENFANEEFEDVTLGEDGKRTDASSQPTKKKGLFARFSESTERGEAHPKPASHNFSFSSRKKPQSVPSSELTSMPRPGIAAGAPPTAAQAD
jgi:hypothetical protein